MLGLLAGLLGMHALAPGGVTSEHTHARPMTAAMAMQTDCSDGHCGGHHAQHADATCASAAVSAAPELPALLPDPVAVPAHADSACSYMSTAADGTRAPPSLAELQLLRI
jgi:hypothetical protein